MLGEGVKLVGRDALKLTDIAFDEPRVDPVIPVAGQINLALLLGLGSHWPVGFELPTGPLPGGFVSGERGGFVEPEEAVERRRRVASGDRTMVGKGPEFVFAGSELLLNE